MGGLFKPGSTKTSSTSEPWKGQQPFLTDAFGQAQDLFNSRSGTPFYQGDLYAGMNGMTDDGIQANADYATGGGQQLAGQFTGAGTNLFGAGQQGLNAYNALYGAAGQDPTQANISAAGQYADNPYMSGMIDSASRDVTRNLYENELPSLNMGASGSGNMNSSRAGVAEGIMKRGAADQIGDISANMRGQAYSQGLGLAEGARNSNMNALATAGSGYGNVFGQGLGAASQGYGMNYQNNNALINGGQLYQQDQQGQLNADFARWQGEDTRQLDNLARYYGIVGANNWGGTTTGTQPSAGIGQQILGLAATAGGAYLGASERRVKENIVQVGTRDDGLNVYDFDYRKGHGLPTGRQRGVMVDEVEIHRPDALGPIVNGVRTVDYGKLG